MLRLTDGRPIRTLCRDSGTTTGSPGDGHGSSLSCTAYQSGSTHTSVTHSTGTAGATGAAASGAAAGAASGATGAGDGGAGEAGGAGAPAGPRSRALGAPSPSGGRGMVPVVKS